MPVELVNFISQYGYLAIFILVFLQEIGVPNPVPNELVLLFSGYLAYTGTLSFPIVFASAVLGDFLGTTLLYTVFYYFGKKILEKKPRWIPIDTKKIERLGKIITEKDRWGIFIGRLIPYIRGYASVAAGILQLRPRIFLSMVAISAIIWSGGYVLIGYLSHNYWNIVLQKFAGTSTLIYIVLAIVFVWFFGRHIFKQLVKK
jgi:membrane protein DedA with SNARE-associated domain